MGVSLQKVAGLSVVSNVAFCPKIRAKIRAKLGHKAPSAAWSHNSSPYRGTVPLSVVLLQRFVPFLSSKGGHPNLGCCILPLQVASVGTTYRVVQKKWPMFQNTWLWCGRGTWPTDAQPTSQSRKLLAVDSTNLSPFLLLNPVASEGASEGKICQQTQPKLGCPPLVISLYLSSCIVASVFATSESSLDRGSFCFDFLFESPFLLFVDNLQSPLL